MPKTMQHKRQTSLTNLTDALHRHHRSERRPGATPSVETGKKIANLTRMIEQTEAAIQNGK